MAHCWLVCGFIDTQVRRYEDSQRCLPMHQTACFWNCCPTGTIQKKTFPHVIKKCVYGICVLCVILLDGISPPPPHVVSGQSHIVHTARPNRVLPFGQKAPNIITTPIKNRPEDLFFKLLRTMRQGGPPMVNALIYVCPSHGTIA